jgi:hypothetical protein
MGVRESDRRYLVRIATWGVPAYLFESAIPYLQGTSGPAWVDAYDSVTSVTVRWEADQQRIVADFRVESDFQGLDPATDAEIMACYWDRETEAEIGGWISGRSAIIGVLPIGDDAESAD